MRIFIIQHYSRNKGDSAVLCSMIHSLRHCYGHIDIIVSSYDPTETNRLYGVKSVDWIVDSRALSGKKMISILKEGVYGIYYLLWFTAKRFSITLPLINRSKAAIVKQYINSDVVVVPGGHFFTSLNNLPTVFCHIIALFFAQLIDKPTMIYSHTIGPFEGKTGFIKKSLCKLVLQKTKVITVREKNSLKVLEDLNIIKPHIEVTAETAFLMPDPDPMKTLKILEKYGATSSNKVGITIHHIYYKYYFTEKRYVELMAQIADFLAEDLNAKIVFIAMEMRYHNGGDRPLARRIIQNMNHSENAILLEDEFTPLETLGIIDQMDLFVGTKTHSIIFSLLRGRPTISISYHPKSTEFMKQLGVGEFALPLEGLTFSIFKQKAKLLWREKDTLTEKMQHSLAKVKDSARKNNEVLVSLIR